MHLLASFNASRPTSLQDVPQDWGTRAPGVGVPQTSPSSPNILIVEDEPADSSTMGYYGVVWRVHEPLLASLFWLALGRVLGWPDAVWEGPMPAPEDACARVLQKSCRSRAGQEATPPQLLPSDTAPCTAHPVPTQAKRVRQPRGTSREGRVTLTS